MNEKPQWGSPAAQGVKCNTAGVLLIFFAGPFWLGYEPPRPARGWAVLSGAPGVYSSAILVWGPVPFCPPAGVSRNNHARFFAPTLCT